MWHAIAALGGSVGFDSGSVVCSLCLYGLGHKVIEQLLESSSSCVSAAAPSRRQPSPKVSSSSRHANSNLACPQSAEDSDDEIEIIELLSSRSPSPDRAAALPTAAPEPETEEPASDSYDFEPAIDSTEPLTGDEDSQEPASAKLAAADSTVAELAVPIEPTPVSTEPAPVSLVHVKTNSAEQATLSVAACETQKPAADSPTIVSPVGALLQSAAVKLELRPASTSPQVFTRKHWKKQSTPIARGQRVAVAPTKTDHAGASPDSLCLWYGESRHEIGRQPWTIHDWFMHGIQQRLQDESFA